MQTGEQTLATSAAEAPPTEPRALIEHILWRYHETHRRELPDLVALARKVEAVHAGHPDSPVGLAEFLEALQAALCEHMMKEEMILFPMLLDDRGFMAGMPILRMRHEHVEHFEHLDELARRAHGYAPPADACGSWRALYAGCAKLDRDLREHIGIENETLFPMFEGQG